VVTIIVMLVTDLLKGVGAGLVVAVFFIIRNSINFSFEVIEDVIDGRRNYLIKLPQHITFFNKGFIIKFLNKLKSNSRVIIDGSINRSTDKDVQEVLADFIAVAKDRNIEIQLVQYQITQ
jgi:MFS superfamily sulfate permease-like transporter